MEMNNNFRNEQDRRQIQMPQNNDIINENNAQQNKSYEIKPRKNRTLQYYKFLFYSMKVEIQATELVNIVKSSIFSEISLWVLSAILHNKFQGAFIYFHFLHVLRAIFGIVILYKMPRSNELVEAMESEKYQKDMEKKIFNDYTRNIINLEIFTKASSLNMFMLIYMIITLLNIFLDIIDFIMGLSEFDGEGHSNSDKINICVNFFIVFLYLAIDLTYLFWFSSMGYIFPRKYLDPITDGFYGMFSKIKTYFKFGKKETDLQSEDLNNKNLNIENNPIFGNGVRNEINNQSGLEVENRNQNDNGFNNNPKSENKNKPYEENLDF